MQASYAAEEASRGMKARDDRHDEVLLVMNHLEPGDILLTRAPGVIPAFVAWITRGRYSHAALFLSRAHLLESNTHLTRIHGIPALGQIATGVVWSHVARIPGQPSHAVVLRDISLGKIPAHELRANINALLHDFQGRNYSTFERLMQINGRARWLRVRILPVARLIDRCLTRNKPLPGVFCSELIATFLHRTGRLWHVPELDPSEVSPNDLLECGLVEVPSTILRQSEVGEVLPPDPAFDLLSLPLAGGADHLADLKQLVWKIQEQHRQTIHTLQAFLGELESAREAPSPVAPSGWWVWLLRWIRRLWSKR